MTDLLKSLGDIGGLVAGLALVVALFGLVLAVLFDVRAGRHHNVLLATLAGVGDNVVKDIEKSGKLTRESIARAADLIERAAERTFKAIEKDGAQTRKVIADVHKSIH